MTQLVDIFDLATLELGPGEGRSLDVRVRAAPFDLGGQRYGVDGDGVDARVDVSRTLAGGYAMHMRFSASLTGECMRCLEPAHQAVDVDVHEIEQAGEGEDLKSPYLTDGLLDLQSWAHDALMLALPAQIVCREDCRGLCAVCGANLNNSDPAEHDHDSGGDPRWAKLKDWKPAG